MTVAAGLAAATPAAHASDFGVELNGTYRVTTNGEFAKVNEVFKDVPTIVEDWTLSSSCVSPIECEGTATSSRGLDRSVVVRLPEHLLGRRPQTSPIGSSAPTAWRLPASRGSSSGGSTR